MPEKADEIKEPTLIGEKPYTFGFIVCAGSLPPLALLIVELATKLCAETFF